MKVKIVPIGNSKGIRIPNSFLKQCNFGNSVDMKLDDNRLILRAVSGLRSGWDEAFKAMAAAGDDKTLDESSNKFDQDEWQW